MSFTPVSWLAEKASAVRVGGRQLRDQMPTEHVPAPVLKVVFWLVIILLFLDEFLILAAVVGGPLAFILLVGFAITVLWVRRTERGRRTKRTVTSRVTDSVKTGRDVGYRTRRRKRK